MTYKNNSDLPDKVKDHLPSHAQDIYREAFNNAFEQYKAPGKRDDKSDSNEETAHKVAWAAVKKEYQKDDKSGKWQKK